MRITAIERLKRKRRYEVRIDHVLVVPLSPEVLAQANLRTGQEISDAQIEAIEEAEARHSALASALRLLAYRPRSEKEMRQALNRRKVRPDLVDATVNRLCELRLLDDREFARSYVDLKDRTSPRSRRMLRSELLSRGLDAASLDEPLSGVDDEDAAYRAGAKKARSLSNTEYADFRRRLGDYLLRRGFNHEVARGTVRRLWEEQRGESALDEDDVP